MRQTRNVIVRFTLIFMMASFLLAYVMIPLVNASEDRSVYDRLSRGERMLQSKAYITPSEPTVYLTFDDGPSRHTEEILNILRDEGIHATFFVLGEAAMKHPELVQQIVSEGHAIGNHTFNHRYDSLYTSFESFWEQVVRTDETIKKLTGVQTRLLRAPGGTYMNFDPFYYYYLDQAGYQIYDWTIDSGDSLRRDVPASEIVNHVKNGRLTHEINVLMHDTAIHAETVEALPDIIQYFKEEGYVFQPITESVRPVHQSLGHLQWVRSNTLALHNERMALVSGGYTDPEPYPLHLRLENAPPAISPAIELNDHLLIEGRFYLPLREWSDWFGGKIQWDQSAQVAKESYGELSLEWHATKGVVMVQPRSSGSGKQSLTSMQATELLIHEGRIYVPIRELTSVHEMKIVSITLHPEKRELILRK